MLIRCPKCHVCYRIDEKLVPEKGRKFRCMSCKNVWLAIREDLFEETPENVSEIYDPEKETAKEAEKAEAEQAAAEMEDAALYQVEMPDINTPPAEEKTTPTEDSEEKKEEPQPETDENESAEETAEEAPAEEPEAEEDKDEISAEDLAAAGSMQEIFSRLNKQSNLLAEQEKKISPLKKFWMSFKRDTGLDKTSTKMLWLAVACGIVVLALFSFRYDIVRSLPWLESVYAAVGVDSVVIGEGLEFKNVSRHEYEEDYIKKLQIKGFLLNTTEKEITVPLIHVEVLSKDVVKLQEMNVKPPVEKIRPGKRIAFNITLTQPSPLSKHILLTFAKKEKK